MKQAIELGAQQSSRVLQGACREHQTVFLLPKVWTLRREMVATLGTCTDDCFEAIVAESCQLGEAELLGLYCHCTMTLADGQYFFDSVIFSALRDAEGCWRLKLGIPETIGVYQRRHAKRLAMAVSSTVQLSREDDGAFSSHEGWLYNLSKDGLALKLSEAHAAALQVGQKWCVCFEIPEDDHFYKLEAVLRRKLPSAHAGYFILGVEFEESECDSVELKRLESFLSERHVTRASTGE